MQFFSGIVKHKKLIFAAFILAAVAGAIMRPFVGVNYDMKDYLPDESPSTRAIKIMEEEFGGDMPNARVMVKDVTYEEALDYKEKIGHVEGVSSVTWLDDSSLLSDAPLAFVDKDARDFCICSTGS